MMWSDRLSEGWRGVEGVKRGGGGGEGCSGVTRGREGCIEGVG